MPAAGRRLAIIHNPLAGQWRRRRYAALLQALRRDGWELREMPTLRRGDAERLAALVTPADGDMVVAAGGDGTINEVINGLMANQVGGRDLPLALLPLGTANVLAGEIGLSTDVRSITRCLLAGEARRIALGRANDRYFVIMAGVGFDAHVVERVDPALKHGLGKVAYVAETLRQFAHYRFPSFRVRVDGKSFEAASAVVANGRYYGGRLLMAPGANVEEATLQVVLFHHKDRLHAIKYALALLLGLLPRLPDVTRLDAQQVRIEGPAGEPVQGDGDIIASLPADFTVTPRAINLLFPPR